MATNNNIINVRAHTYSDVVISGSDNTIGAGCTNIIVMGDRNTVDPGLSNVFILGTSDLTITTSDVLYIAGKKIDFDTTTNGKVLKYVSATETWEAGTDATGGGGGGGSAVPVVYTFTDADSPITLTDTDGIVLVLAGGSGAISVTLPSAASVSPACTAIITVKNTGTSTITVNPYGLETIDGYSSVSIVRNMESLTFINDASNWFLT